MVVIIDGKAVFFIKRSFCIQKDAFLSFTDNFIPITVECTPITARIRGSAILVNKKELNNMLPPDHTCGIMIKDGFQY